MIWKILFLVIAGVALPAVEPQHEWDFDRTNARNQFADSGISPEKAPLSGCKAEGIDGSAGIRCSDKQMPYGRVPLDYPAYTIELKFKMANPFERGKPRGLFNYEFWSWNRRSFRIRIDEKGCLECFFNVSSETKKPLRFLLTSEALKWLPNRWYTLRVAGEKGKTVKIWLDGKLIAAGNGAPCLDDINDRVKHEYDYAMRLGWDTSDPRLPHGKLDGVIDDVKIWNSFEPPSGNASVTSAAPGSAVSDSNPRAKYTIIGRDKDFWTAKFDVPDQAGHAVGSFERAGGQFIAAAATASISMDKDHFIVKFNCPIPKGMKAASGTKSLWDSDYVEFFLRPDPCSDVYYQYCAGTNGATAASRFRRRLIRDESFRSKAVFKVDTAEPDKFKVDILIPKEEVGCTGIADGTVMTGNFCRGGKTAGGLSSWIPMSGDFHAIDSFGKFIAGSSRAYFDHAADQLKSKLDSLKGASAMRAELEQAIARQKNENAVYGNDASRFESMELGLENLRAMLVSFTLSGKPYFLWENDMWGNRCEPSMLSKPVEKIHLRAAQNSRVLYGMMVSNLTDRPFLGLIKCLEKWPLQSLEKSIYVEPWNDFLRNIDFSEGLMLQDAGGKPLYDPMLPLPMKNILRVPPHGNVPLWITISTRNLKPGTYRGTVVIKPSYAGFPVETVPLELEVLPIDFSQVKLDSFHYAFFTERPVNCKYYTDIIHFYRYLADQEANVMFAGHLTEVYPDQNPDGTLKPVNFDLLDRKIDTYIKAGIPRDRLKLMFNLHTFIFIWRDAQGNTKPPVLKFGTPEFERGFMDFIRQLYAHLEKKFNLPPDHVIIYTGDEPEGDVNDPKSRMHRVYYLGKLVRKAVPGASTATNPYPRKGLDAKFIAGMEKLCETHNILIIGTHAKSPALTDLLKKKNAELWTYAVYNKSVSPETYRQMFFKSFREGYGSPNAYWAIDSYSGDGFDPNDYHGDWKGGYSTGRMDYGSAYCDMNLGTVASGRRAEAHFQGLLDYKAMSLCKKLISKSKNPQYWQKKLDDIVSRGCRGSCVEMDRCHNELLDLILEMRQK